MHSPDELTRCFRERGLKVTPQRQAVFRALHRNDAHPTAEAVHRAVAEEMPTVSLRTVYQTLNDLAAMGEILHLDLGTGSARFDPNVEALHHHLVCERCGLVRDLPGEHGDVQVAPPVAAAAIPEGFVVSTSELVVRGRCAECAGDSPATPGTPATPAVPGNPATSGNPAPSPTPTNTTHTQRIQPCQN